MQANATIPTGSAKRTLGQFVKHFSHRLPFALLDTNEVGEVRFPFGLCALAADEAALRISLHAEAQAELGRLQEVVTSHLVRFGFRETLVVDWQAPAPLAG